MSSGGQPVSTSSENEHQTSSFIRYILNRFNRAQKNGARSSNDTDKKTKEKELSIPKDTSEAQACSRQDCQSNAEEEVSSGPHVKSQHANENRVGESKPLKGILKTSKLQSVSEPTPVDRKSELEEIRDSAVSSRPIPDASLVPESGWDFRKNAGRRRLDSRSAQEWVRDSDVSASDWTSELRLYSLPEPNTHSSEGVNVGSGNFTSRSRSRSLGNLIPYAQNGSSEDTEQAPIKPVHKPSKVASKPENEQDAVQKASSTKRNSFEAGLAVADPGIRASAEKIRRHNRGIDVSNSDFLPSELRERSLLFNTQYLD